MKDMNELVAELIEAAKANDRQRFSEVFLDRDISIDGNELLNKSLLEAIQRSEFEAAVLINRALEARILRTGLRERRAAAVSLSLTDATDEQLINEVKRRGLA